MLIAFANECRRREVNYQTSALFVAQDVDFLAGCMCYIQLSLMGCPGYVVIDNTITNPVTSYDRRGLLPRGGANIWRTPMYYRDAWHWRRVWWQLDSLLSDPRPVAGGEAKVPASPELEIRGLKETEAGQMTLFWPQMKRRKNERRSGD